MREIKFRAWSTRDNSMSSFDTGFNYRWFDEDCQKDSCHILMQYTGLKDKNGDNDIYECDIIDTDGNVIGNQYETPALLEKETNLLIQGFGTKDWLTTYTQAVERGCHDS